MTAKQLLDFIVSKELSALTPWTPGRFVDYAVIPQMTWHPRQERCAENFALLRRVQQEADDIIYKITTVKT